MVRGTGASPGSALGPAFVASRPEVVIEETDDPRSAFGDAAQGVMVELGRLSQTASAAGRQEAASVLQAQSLMAEDPMLHEAVMKALDNGASLQAAIAESAAELAAMLAELPDPYLAARSTDVLEVADRITRRLARADRVGLDGIDRASVVIAKALTAADTAQLDRDLVLGFVTEEGGPTGHVAVIARSLGIPAVVGAESIVGQVSAGSAIAIDGDTGEVVVEPDQATVLDFSQRAKRTAQRRTAAAAFRAKRVVFGDRPIAVSANVGGPADVDRARDAGADGVGLYRTEFLFLDRSEPPGEDEQLEVYRSALAAFDDPVVVRTFDIGGDKPASYLDTPSEDNPFLGERGVRIYERFDEVFRTQVRALLRASLAGDLWIMIPMVATVSDLTTTLATIDEVRSALEGDGAPVRMPKVGTMIEVPSAALNADRMAAHAQFFSIGTNDLTQYVLAADRTNGRLARYADAADPAVLRLCRETARAGLEAGITTSVCGEAAADPILAVLFLAMGISRLSVSAPSVDLVKSVVAGTPVELASRALESSLQAAGSQEVRALVGDMIELP
jgi:phosphoenolpyruvate-protein phosphotransferase